MPELKPDVDRNEVDSVTAYIHEDRRFLLSMASRFRKYDRRDLQAFYPYEESMDIVAAITMTSEELAAHFRPLYERASDVCHEARALGKHLSRRVDYHYESAKGFIAEYEVLT